MAESNWGRWGDDDQCGALNLVGAQQVCDAARLVRAGRVLSLAQPFGPDAMTAPHRHSPARFMDRDAGDYASGARSPDGFRFAEDTVQLATHSGTHLDALAHTWSGEELYNAHPAASIRSTTGAARCGAEHLIPVAARGVLLDVASSKPLEPSAPVGVEQLVHACRSASVDVVSGDVVLIRTGWWERGLDHRAYHRDEPGLTTEAAHWLAERDVAVVGADNYAVEQQPSPKGTTFPVHLLLLHRHGVPLLENLDLSQLALTGRHEFLLVLAPLPLTGSTASPVNPVAVL